MKKVINIICIFIAIPLMYLGIGGFVYLISPPQPGVSESVAIIMGSVALLLGVFLRRLTLSEYKENRNIVIVMDICLIIIIHTFSIVIDLATSLHFAILPMPKLVAFLLSLYGYIRIRKNINQSEIKHIFYITPLIILIILSLTYIPYMITYGSKFKEYFPISTTISLFTIATLLTLYEIVKTTKHYQNIKSSVKYILSKSLVIVLSILALLGFGFAKVIGQDISRLFSPDGMTRQERMMSRTVSTNSQSGNNASSELYIDNEKTSDLTTIPIEEFNEDTIKEIQTKLKDLDLYDGKIDGIFGENTERGIKFFQIKNSLFSANGINMQTLDALGIDY